MDTILDYIQWKRDVPFAVRDVTEVDSIVFSFLSYMDLKEIITHGQQMTVAQCCAAMLAHPEGISPHHRALYEALADSKRFGPVVIGSYQDSLVEEKNVQFSAMLLTIGRSCSGPREQFTPIMSAPIASRVTAAVWGSVPVTVRPSSL